MKMMSMKTQKADKKDSQCFGNIISDQWSLIINFH